MKYGKIFFFMDTLYIFGDTWQYCFSLFLLSDTQCRYKKGEKWSQCDAKLHLKTRIDSLKMKQSKSNEGAPVEGCPGERLITKPCRKGAKKGIKSSF